jgi:glutamate formiminotransferase
VVQTIVECVPNFSEGRDRRTLEQIAAAIESVAGVFVLDLHMDPDHNRSVITFAASKENVGEAAVRAAGAAAERIDMNRHRGEHPRVGATDVVPFVPVRGVTLNDCAQIARVTGTQIANRLGIPVYFYGAAALRPERVQLENIRRGGYERLKEFGLDDPATQPDAGEGRLHPTAGATIIGARPYLVAFNINLDCSERTAATQIARAIRASSGGLPGVKAIGLLLASRNPGGQRGQAQVSMNLTDLSQTSVAKAYRGVEMEAAKLGITIHSSEIVGLAPKHAFAGIQPEDIEHMKLADHLPDKILENRLAAFFGPEELGTQTQESR